jgi:hypothetical protein
MYISFLAAVEVSNSASDSSIVDQTEISMKLRAGVKPGRLGKLGKAFFLVGSINGKHQFLPSICGTSFFSLSTRPKGLWALLVTRLACSLACLWIYAT